MTDAINSNNRVKPPGPALDNRGRAPAQGPSNEVSGTTGRASAIVELSSEQVLKQMAALPEVNSSRVEAIKSALANGDYKPDPELIARKFSEIEDLLP